jgi:hypothetical protein
MDDWCHAMNTKFPDAYETHYAWYLNGHFYDDEKSHLMKANELAPKEPRVLKAVFAFYMMKNELTNAKDLLAIVAGLYSKNELNYYKDAAPTSGTIIVSSNTDAIPLYILQLQGAISSSLNIVNMDFLLNDQYRSQKSGTLQVGDLKFGGSEATYLNKALSSSANVYLSSTVSQAYFGSYTEGYFVTGLFYQYEPASQLKSLNAFWNLIKTKNFSSLSLTSSEKKIYTNYLPPLLTLYQLKLMQGNKDDVLRQGIVVLGDKVGRGDEVTKILAEYD